MEATGLGESACVGAVRIGKATGEGITVRTGAAATVNAGLVAEASGRTASGGDAGTTLKSKVALVGAGALGLKGLTGLPSTVKVDGRAVLGMDMGLAESTVRAVGAAGRAPTGSSSAGAGAVMNVGEPLTAAAHVPARARGAVSSNAVGIRTCLASTKVALDARADRAPVTGSNAEGIRILLLSISARADCPVAGPVAGAKVGPEPVNIIRLAMNSSRDSGA